MVNGIVLLVGIVTFFIDGFNYNSAIFGLIGGLCEAVGKVANQNAVTKGLAGPATAIIGQNSMLLLTVEALLDWKMLNPVELVAFFFNFWGQLILVVPKFFTRRMCKCLSKKKQKKEQPLVTTALNESGYDD